MLEFRKAELKDKEEIERLLASTGCPSLEYNFATIFLWQDHIGGEFAISEDVLFLRAGGDVKSYLFPCGYGDIEKALFKIPGEVFGFHSLTEEQAKVIEKVFPDRFYFYENRDSEDYVYERESLANLKGKKLSAKRNHINRFVEENPDWSYEEVTEQNIEEVSKMHDKWCDMADMEEKKGLVAETAVVKKALKFFRELGLSGGLIRVRGEVCAFSLGDPLNENTFLVHIEKAFGNITGAYQIMNREFVRNNCEGYEFINREEDTGSEGLRKAKLSYRPHHLVKKIYAKEIKK